MNFAQESKRRGPKKWEEGRGVSPINLLVCHLPFATLSHRHTTCEHRHYMSMWEPATPYPILQHTSNHYWNRGHIVFGSHLPSISLCLPEYSAFGAFWLCTSRWCTSAQGKREIHRVACCRIRELLLKNLLNSIINIYDRPPPPGRSLRAHGKSIVWKWATRNTYGKLQYSLCDDDSFGIWYLFGGIAGTWNYN